MDNKTSLVKFDSKLIVSCCCIRLIDILSELCKIKLTFSPVRKLHICEELKIFISHTLNMTLLFLFNLYLCKDSSKKEILPHCKFYPFVCFASLKKWTRRHTRLFQNLISIILLFLCVSIPIQIQIFKLDSIM